MKQAVSLVIDRAEVVSAVHNGFGTPITNILNYSTPFYKDIPVIQIYVLFTGTVYVTITSAVNILSVFLNPKLRVVI